MRLRANEADYTQIVVKGIPSLFTEMRVVRDSVPEGFYLYEVRCDDDGLGDPSQIGSCVIVNFLGTLLASEELELPCSGYLDIDPESDWGKWCVYRIPEGRYPVGTADGFSKYLVWSQIKR